MWPKVRADQKQIWSALVGLRSGVSGGFYSFLAIYLEVKIFFAIFANKKGNYGTTDARMSESIFHDCTRINKILITITSKVRKRLNG